MCFVLELISAGCAGASDLRRRGGVCAGCCKSAVCDEVTCREGTKSRGAGSAFTAKKELHEQQIS